MIAIQHGEQILNLAASFQVPESGYEHQFPMAAVDPPHKGETEAERFAKLSPEEQAIFPAPDTAFAIEIRRLGDHNPYQPQKDEPYQKLWFRASGAVGDDPVLNQCLLAYATDMSLLSTCALPHGVSWFKGIQMASLDHVIWFHAPVRADQWMLYDQDSPWSGGARGFNRGSVYSQDGVLLASVAQEGLIRPLANG